MTTSIQADSSNSEGKSAPPRLARHWIDGEWVGPDLVSKSINPATGAVLGEWADYMLGKTLLGRLGRPEEVASVALSGTRRELVRDGRRPRCRRRHEGLVILAAMSPSDGAIAQYRSYIDATPVYA